MASKTGRPKTTRREPATREVPDLLADQLAALRAVVPGAFTEGKLDLEKLGAILGQSVPAGPERFTFTWAGRQDASRILQLPARASLYPKRDQSIDFDTTENLFVEGENLEVLKLLYKPYFGQVKMIYIDPPYNTGNDFVYPDNYAEPLKPYLQLTGQLDSEGNLLTSQPETSGRFHSAWLSMMYPRLFLARNLLTDDGVIFISIDDREVANLKLLMNEVFGEENFVAQITVRTNPRGRTLDKFLARTHEYVLIYARDADSASISGIAKTPEAIAAYDKVDTVGKYRELELRNRNPVFNRGNRPNLYYALYVDPTKGDVRLERDEAHRVEVFPLNSKGEEGCWTWGKEKVSKNLQMLLSRSVSTGVWRVFRKDYLTDDTSVTKAKSIWDGPEMNHENGKEELGRLFGFTPFDFPKSVGLIGKCVELGTSGVGGEIVLDFFAGSGTTAQAVLEANKEDGGNRRFILVQLPEPTPEDSVARGKGFTSLSQIGAERIRLLVKRLRPKGRPRLPEAPDATAEDLGFRFLSLGESNMRPWSGVEKPTSEAWTSAMQEQIDPLIQDWKTEDVILEIAIKEGLTPVIEVAKDKEVADNTVFKVKDRVTERELRVCLDEKVKPSTVRTLRIGRDDVFVCRDVALDDSAAANLALQCRLKTI
jgi:adenine-specific DNA-methyltransferase